MMKSVLKLAGMAWVLAAMGLPTWGQIVPEDLNDGSPVQGSDVFVIRRSGDSYKLVSTDLTVSYGGVQLGVSESDATPAFDLVDASNFGDAVDIVVDTEANKPAAGTADRIFYDTTNDELERDTGSAWQVIAEPLGKNIEDGEVDDNITISASGSVADGALSSNVSLLAQNIEDGEVDDNITVSASGSVADGALSSNVSLLAQNIEDGEVDDNITIGSGGSVAIEALQNTATIADDAAQSVTPTRTAGKITITDETDDAADFFFDVGADAAISKVGDPNAAFTATTGNHGGTTGVDGDLTVAADGTNSQIDIENRTGGSITVRWFLVE